MFIVKGLIKWNSKSRLKSRINYLYNPQWKKCFPWQIDVNRHYWGKPENLINEGGRSKPQTLKIQWFQTLTISEFPIKWGPSFWSYIHLSFVGRFWLIEWKMPQCGTHQFMAGKWRYAKDFVFTEIIRGIKNSEKYIFCRF